MQEQRNITLHVAEYLIICTHHDYSSSTFHYILFQATCGILIGSLLSACQLALSQSNTGGAWDNAKKYVEKGCVKVEDKDGRKVVMGKGTEIHKASVVGDTVGDPLKDTSGPALNIVMKLQAIISLVFCDFFLSVNCGKGYFNIASNIKKFNNCQ